MKDNNQYNLGNYMNLAKKNKSAGKINHKSIMPSYIVSLNNTKKINNYPSSLQENGIILIKKKLKQSKINNNNNNYNQNPKNNSSTKAPISSYVSFNTPPINNYCIKKKKDNISTNKALKNHLLLTSMNNSSIINSKDKILSYSINNISNYQSNNFLFIKNKNYIAKNSMSHPKKNSNVYNNNNYINGTNNKFNMIKKSNRDKKYALTSGNSRKNSIDKEGSELMKKVHKMNFNELLSGPNNNSNNNSNLYINNNNINKSNKKFFIRDFFQPTKKAKHSNHFLESYLKKPQSSNHRQNIKNQSNVNNENIENYNNISNSPNKNIFYKTAKISPRTSLQNKKQEYIQSHRICMKNKISGSILAFYNDNNKKLNNNKGVSSVEKSIKGNLYNNSNFIYNNYNYNNFMLKKHIKKGNINDNSNSNNIANSNINMASYINFQKCTSLLKHKSDNINNNSSNINSNINNNNNNNGNTISHCQININNINFNNYNGNNNNSNNNNLNNEKILDLLKKKNLINIINGKFNKIFSQSQHDIIAMNKKTKNSKDYKTSNNSPNNYHNNINNSNIQTNIKITTNHNNKNKSNEINDVVDIQKLLVQVKDKINKNKNPTQIINNQQIKNNINSLDINVSSDEDIKINSQNEILELKNNLQEKTSQTNINKINNQSISCNSSTTRDSNYYMEQCKKLIKYIRGYYNQNHKYPPTDLSFYLYGRLIGQGAFGKVNIGLNILTGRVVAIKSFNKKNLGKNGENMRKILYETNLMKKLNHPNITKILEMFEDDEYYLIAMEYINGGNLFSFVKKRRKLSEKTAKFLFRQIILGIKHIHSQKIVHRDIKLENILIDLNNNIKICDFGIGRILLTKKQLLHDKCGTPMYMAPEILLSSKTNGYEGFPVDIWSSGISLYIMLSGTLPFNLNGDESSSVNDNNLDLQYSIVNKEPKHIEKISDEARDLLKGLLNKNPNERLTCDEILNHPWLKIEEENKKYHLFTKAEMIMLSKTYIDYRKSALDDLKENFTISNLKNDNVIKKLKNITTKSTLLAPYNSIIPNENSIMELDFQDSFDDANNINIQLENDIVIYNNKVKEFNLNYELNNNGEVDNGMLINSKTGTVSFTGTINNSQVSKISRNEENDDWLGEIMEEEKKEENKKKKINKILKEIEYMGFDRDYVLKCVNNNILCHASTIFYLMLNYENI